MIMTRLTRAVCEGWHYEIYYHTLNGVHTLLGDLDFVDKLGQLEDVEEELGIELLVLITAVKVGIYSKQYNAMRKVALTHDIPKKAKNEQLCLYDEVLGQYYYFKDYGKTWALSKALLL